MHIEMQRLLRRMQRKLHFPWVMGPDPLARLVTLTTEPAEANVNMESSALAPDRRMKNNKKYR